ncbi:hypothetical protein N1I81_22770 [Bacillus sp. FSL M8-0052]|uniref:hypothetical protein n=1 Tax=Bacillus sp. FSL M8-0052 TaxID=2978203 RepID=UPI0030F5DCBA
MSLPFSIVIILWGMDLPQKFFNIETNFKGLRFLFSKEWASLEKDGIVTFFTVVSFNTFKFISWTILFILLILLISFVNKEFQKEGVETQK